MFSMLKDFAGPLSQKVHAPGVTLPPGIHLPCYGPFKPPAGARALTSFLPEVNMSVVHHMILFGGSGPGGRGCMSGHIVYSWARTGQSTPVGLDFFGDGLAGDGFAVGPGTPNEWFSLQVHYQQMHSLPIMDSSGIRLSFARAAPRRPIETTIMASGVLRIPPRVFQDECIACRVHSGGTVVAWRNHAHRLARDVWSEVYDRHGVERPPLGRLSAQLPQIFRLLPAPRKIQSGDTLLLHCQYDARETERVSYVGVDAYPGPRPDPHSHPHPRPR